MTTREIDGVINQVDCPGAEWKRRPEKWNGDVVWIHLNLRDSAKISLKLT